MEGNRKYLSLPTIPPVDGVLLEVELKGSDPDRRVENPSQDWLTLL